MKINSFSFDDDYFNEDDFFRLILQGNIEKAIAYKEKKDIKVLKNESKENGQCYLCIKRYGGK